jgi:hypothetical protein
MPLIAACPFCAVKVRLARNVEGASVECPRCRNFFTAASEDALFPKPTSRQPEAPTSPGAAFPTAPAVETDPAAGELRGSEPVAPTRVTVVLPLPAPAAPRVEPWEAAALVGGGLALLTASIPAVSFLTIPLALAGLALAALAPLLRQRPSKLGAWSPVVGAALNLLVLLGAWLWPQLLGREWVRAQATGPEPTKAYFVPASGSHLTTLQPLGPDDWVDAQAGAWRRGDAQVRVVSVEFVPDKTADPAGKKASSILALRLKVSNVGRSHTFAFEGWGGGRAVLRDKQGRDYTFRGAAAGPPAKGSGPSAPLTPPARVAPGRFAEEVLLFEPTAGAAADELFLELALTPLDAEGLLKLRIARTQIARK